MKILLIATSFNGMCQRVWVELDRLDHKVKVHLVSTETEMINATASFKPDLIIAPYLKSAIPAVIWEKYTCFIVHPGIPGDRGACSLDWAVLNNEKIWGVTILQAIGKMDAGPVWATASFPMRNVSKSFLYRHEVTDAAIIALLEALEKFESKIFTPQSFCESNGSKKGTWKRSTNENDFRFSWNEKTGTILNKINAADSEPGALCEISGTEYFCFGAVEEKELKGYPGECLAQRDSAICIATNDSAIWVKCLKNTREASIKLPATVVLDKAISIPASSIEIFDNEAHLKTFSELKYQEENDVGYLYFDFYNGAMSTEQCNRLLQSFRKAKERETKVIVLMGGEDIWCNGIHLNIIEAAADHAQESWENINAIDDLIREIICTTSHFIISALHGNAGAGGVPLALAADKIIARKGIVFNPHTRNMGLYGSEYWTYLLPKRIGDQRAAHFTEQCLPWGTSIAMEVKLIDECIPDAGKKFQANVKRIADEVAHLPYFNQLIAAKKFKRNRDESYKPLAKYREEELAKMQKNFFDDDWGYDYKRYCFVHKINPEEGLNAIAEKDLFSERRKIWRRRKYEKIFYES